RCREWPARNSRREPVDGTSRTCRPCGILLLMRGRNARKPILCPFGRQPASDVEFEVQDVAVLDDVFLPFLPELAGVPGRGLSTERDEILICDGLGANEAALHVGMDFARRLGRPGAAV